MNAFWFKSDQLGVEPGEDQETNPGRFGKSVASWLASALAKKGYETNIQPEDWGWKVQCLSDPCPIWVGCGNMDEVDEEGNLKEPDPSNVIWHCFVEANVPFFKKLFNKLNPEREVSKLVHDISSLLSKTSHVSEVPEP